MERALALLMPELSGGARGSGRYRQAFGLLAEPATDGFGVGTAHGHFYAVARYDKKLAVVAFQSCDMVCGYPVGSVKTQALGVADFHQGIAEAE